MQTLGFKKYSGKFVKSIGSNIKIFVSSINKTSIKNFSSNYVKFNEESKNNQSIEEVMGQSSNSYSQYSGSSYSNQTQKSKRSRVSFVREGMMLTLYLKKPILSTEPNTKNEGYVAVELREFTDNYDKNSRERDPRFILLKGVTLAKFLLLSPKSMVDNPNKLEHITLGQKFRSLDFHQSPENNYVVTLRILPKSDDIGFTQEANAIVSQIELNPEDVIIIQKFINRCIDELLNI